MASGTAETKPGALCTVCDFEADTVKKLKTHLLLKHPKMNLCLFCIDKKGWSDNFASPAQYQEHYNSLHKGTIGKHQERRREEEVRNDKWLHLHPIIALLTQLFPLFFRKRGSRRGRR